MRPDLRPAKARHLFDFNEPCDTPAKGAGVPGLSVFWLALVFLLPLGPGANAAAALTCTDIPATQCAVLSEFYRVTSGTNWSSSNWGAPRTATCDWTGISCRPPRFEGDYSSVIGIDLPNNNLSGRIDVRDIRWQDLPALQVLNLGINKLSGGLPSTLEKLTRLQELDLSNNRITGSLLPGLGSLANLDLLNLQANELTGTIPAAWGNMSSLTTLDVSGNLLSGELPVELGDLTGLNWLNLRDNDFSGSLPETLVNLASLTFFYFDETYLCIPDTPEFSSWLGSVPVTQSTDRSCNICRGNFVPPGYYEWDNKCLALVALYDSTNGADWTSHLGWATSASHCDWEGVTCALDSSFNYWVDRLQLPSNNLTGNLPDLSALARMTDLDLSGNGITGRVPDSFDSLINLQNLKISANPLTGSLPLGLPNLTKLNTFHFDGTDVCIPPDAAFDSWLNGISNLQSNGQTCQPAITVNVTLAPANQSCPGVELLEVTSGTNVRFCYEVTNTGEVTHKLHWLIDSEFGNLFKELEHELAPGVSYTYVLSKSAENTATHKGTWHAYNGTVDDPKDIADASDTATLTVYQNSISFDMTVSLFGDGCPGSDSLVLPSGAEVEYCYEVTNTGGWTLTLHHLTDGVFGTLLDDYPFDLTPGTTHSVSSGAVTLNTTTVNTGFWTASNEGNANALQENDVVKVTVLSCEAVTDIPADECAVLRTLYEEHNGANWPDQIGWWQYSSACSWPGLTCTDNHITGINLTNKHLNGGFPVVLAALPQLAELILNNNDLGGSIPAAIDNFPSLTTLHLHNSGLTGSLPEQLGGLSGLTSLRLSENNITGPVPAQLGNLGQLVELYLYSTGLSGPLPASLVQLINLELFHFYQSQLCELDDAEFQAWLAGIDDLAASGLVCLPVPEPSISLDMTVSTEVGTCPGSDSATIAAGQEVSYCYEVTNTGGITLNLHDLVDSELGVVFSAFATELAPGATASAGTSGVAVEATTTSTATWTAYNAGPANVAEASDSVTVTALSNEDVIFANGFEN